MRKTDRIISDTAIGGGPAEQRGSSVAAKDVVLAYGGAKANAAREFSGDLRLASAALTPPSPGEEHPSPQPSPEGRGGPFGRPRGLASAAAAFAASMARFAASGFKTVDAPLHALRLGQCGPCEHRKGSQCALCRCFVDKKAWLPHEDCPIGRWPA